MHHQPYALLRHTNLKALKMKLPALCLPQIWPCCRPLRTRIDSLRASLRDPPCPPQQVPRFEAKNIQQGRLLVPQPPFAGSRNPLCKTTGRATRSPDGQPRRCLVPRLESPRPVKKTRLLRILTDPRAANAALSTGLADDAGGVVVLRILGKCLPAGPSRAFVPSLVCLRLSLSSLLYLRAHPGEQRTNKIDGELAKGELISLRGCAYPASHALLLRVRVNDATQSQPIHACYASEKVPQVHHRKRFTAVALKNQTMRSKTSFVVL